MTPAPQRPPDFVWIDDQYWRLTSLLRHLLDEGYTYEGIESFGQARQEIESLKRARLIILDLIIPLGEGGVAAPDTPYVGEELLRQLRAAAVTAPVIIYTVVREPEVLERLRTAPNVLGVFSKGERNLTAFTELARTALKRPR